MSGINKVIILGRLGRDPEIRHTQDGKAVANLSVATSESWTDSATNSKKEKTEWHKVVIFGKLAEVAGQYLKKGSEVFIEGKLQTRKWTDNNGQDRYTTEIVVDMKGTMQMVGGRASQQAAGQAQGQGQPAQGAPNQAPVAQPQQAFGQQPQQGFVQGMAPQQQAQQPQPASQPMGGMQQQMSMAGEEIMDVPF